MLNPLSGVILLIILILLAMPDKTLMDADSGWHIMAGRYITNNWSIPHDNVFSYTTGDYEWLNISWLWDVLLNFVYTYGGGLYFVVIFVLALVAATYFIITYTCLARGGGIISTAEIFIAASIPLLSTSLVRPQIATYLLTAIMLCLCYRVKNKLETWPLFLFPFIEILWVNMHGGFVVGLSIMLAFALELLLKRGYGHKIALSISCVLCLGFVFINPLGPHIFEAVARSFTGPLAQMIDEWKIPRDPLDYLYTLLFLAVFIFKRKNFSLAEILLSLFWLVQSLMAVRNLPVFIIVSAPAVAASLHQFILTRAEIANKDAAYRQHFSLRALILCCTGIIIIAATSWGQKINHFSIGKIANYPKQEVDYIMASQPELKYFNNYDIGGFVLLGSSGKIKTFIDGRAETAFPPQVIDDYIKFHTDQPDWQLILDKYGINGILLAKYQTKQIAELNSDPAWQQVFAGDKAVVYLRRRR